MSFANRPTVNIEEGEPYVHQLTFTNPDGSAKDMSMYSFSAQLRDAPDGNLLGTFSFDMTNADVGIVVGTLPAACTSGWDDAYISFRWTISGEPFTFMRAKARRKPQITE